MSILKNRDAYRLWRDEKINNVKGAIDDFWVDIQNPENLTLGEYQKIITTVAHHNFALFRCRPKNPQKSILAMNRQLGLRVLDQHFHAPEKGLALITVGAQKTKRDFIPYTDKALGWHTDGYYNDAKHRVRAFTLFCQNPATIGGENLWMDHQMLYIAVREKNPDWAAALAHPEAMSIPAHQTEKNIRRKAATGPIYFIDEKTGDLSMRYTQRKIHIQMRASSELEAAVRMIDEILSTPSAQRFKHTFQSGEGIVCNNIIHARTQFQNDPKNPRQMLRGRYFQKINAPDN